MVDSQVQEGKEGKSEFPLRFFQSKVALFGWIMVPCSLNLRPRQGDVNVSRSV
jgi:hypothetical protein